MLGYCPNLCEGVSGELRPRLSLNRRQIEHVCGDLRMKPDLLQTVAYVYAVPHRIEKTETLLDRDWNPKVR
jgi:hypothetical protein